jgi:hypothetical protein
MEEGSIFCKHCGAKISSEITNKGIENTEIESTKEDKKEGWHNKLLRWSVAVAAVIVIAIARYGYLSCDNTTHLAKQVQASILEEWRKTGITVSVTEKLMLVKKGKTEYTGIMTVSTEGESETISVDVVYDGKTFIWEIQ